jgi:AcrR family transcriptional regulator
MAATPATPARTVAELFGQPPLPAEGRDRLIAAGIELFSRHGIGSVGLDRVIDAAGVTKTTFYKHFESKDELVVECVKSRHEWEMDAWDRATRRIAGDDPRARLLAFFDVLDQWFNAPDFRGCMFINVAAEFPDPRDPIHKAAALHKTANRDAFRELAARAGAADPDVLADQFTIILEGTLILRQVHSRDDAARIARSAVERLLDLHVRPGDAPVTASAAARG